MPDTNDSHGESKIIFEDDNWLIVEPMDYDSYLYYAPPPMKSKWNEFREGDVFFTIDKNNNSSLGVRTYTVFKNINGKWFYYHWNGDKFEKSDFFAELPSELQEILSTSFGVGKIYGLLSKIVRGEEVSAREMENADDAIYDFKYSTKNPFKSLVTLRFDEEDYIGLFNPSDEDMWYYNNITSSYNSYEWEDDYQAKQDFAEGYLLAFFNDENLIKVKQILSIIEPSSVPLETDDQKSSAGEKLLDMFNREIDDIVSDYVAEMNQCKTRAFIKTMNDTLCNPFFNYGIFTKYCFREYFTSVNLLVSLYDSMGDKTLTISELLFKIGSEMNLADWAEYMYETQCDDFDEESFDKYTSDNLDKILEKLEDESQYVDIYEYSELYKRLDSKYKINNRYETKSGREFFYRGINPENNRILVQVFKKEDGGGLEDRSYTEEEFNNFLVSPELFEGFIRIN
jgi:hypothetical protein